MELGRLGVWVGMDRMSAAAGAAFAKRVEDWGYGALWLPESRGRNALVHYAWLLANTQKLVVATGIANIYARDPMAMANGQRALAEQSEGRFLLGVGVSHRPMVEGLRGHTYSKPVATMRAYLKAMREAPYAAAVQPRETPLTVVAALGPRMMALSGEMADGAHPYNSIPAHTAEARKILGPGKILAPEVWVLLKTDPSTARRAAREALSHYLQLENYVNAWRGQGFSDADMASGGTDRFIDAIVGWGDEAAIRKRIQEHWDAGADHVCIQPISAQGGREVDERVLELLAPSRRS
jgi:probable F420-dependent oxidoreductase